MNNNHLRPAFAAYQHSVPGFPHVILKWHEDKGIVVSQYVTIKGKIHPWTFETGHGMSVNFDRVIPHFEAWVRAVYWDDVTVQG